MIKKLYPLCENHLFSKAYRKGKSAVSKYVAVYVLNNYDRKAAPQSSTKLGITINRKLGKAVKRNRVKRMIRAAYRMNLPELKQGYLIVVAARGAAFSKGIKTKDVYESMRYCFEKLGICEEKR
jgi:ribonuclease P protein component